jgi:hypothetical protein
MAHANSKQLVTNEYDLLRKKFPKIISDDIQGIDSYFLSDSNDANPPFKRKGLSGNSGLQECQQDQMYMDLLRKKDMMSMADANSKQLMTNE